MWPTYIIGILYGLSIICLGIAGIKEIVIGWNGTDIIED